jgi:hypothetical protein
MTHEYTILVNGVVEGHREAASATPIATATAEARATAVAYAGGVVLAVGTDDEIRAISRGDSRLIDLEGRHVISLAQAAVRTWPAVCDRDGIDRLGALAALHGRADELDIGSPADFAVCSVDGCLEAIVFEGVVVWGRLGP